ncbi:SRPBCC domain-containing protein [Chitinophaga qingshengii]|uniref:SRPBCC domain-containing protein n=1 Tax=Chitinophaga qingshengii TaxID=1569794 RepID=A0ABR7TR61_9BACT|nr:SRPBCC domain-containing protein [Chitinophaga qingshengii]MBC9932975.1 SRPBCC domain-containing protein [Chitinophaga qingshengii]
MELKTKVTAEEGKQELIVTREFDLPLDLLFRAYTEPELVAEWMGTKVLKLENKKYGSWRFETTDPQGNKHGFSGTIHDFVPNQKIVRTFEMENSGFGVQLEFLEFEQLTDNTSKLRMHIIYKTLEERAQYLQIGMARGMGLAHNRLEKAAFKFLKY